MPDLAFFTITGNLTAVIADYVDVGVTPDLQKVTATVRFIPRIPRGQILWASGLTPKQGIALTTIRARFDTDGYLRTIVGDAGVQLVANTADLNLDQLIYDCVFADVVYNKQDQLIHPMAFEAPVTGGLSIDMADIDWLPPQPGLA